MSDNVIEVQDLTKRYNGTAVVNGISFSVARGEIFGLLGPNGAGKTTTLETCEGYRKPQAGSVSVLGLVSPGWSRSWASVEQWVEPPTAWTRSPPAPTG